VVCAAQTSSSKTYFRKREIRRWSRSSRVNSTASCQKEKHFSGLFRMPSHFFLCPGGPSVLAQRAQQDGMRERQRDGKSYSSLISYAYKSSHARFFQLCVWLATAHLVCFGFFRLFFFLVQSPWFGSAGSLRFFVFVWVFQSKQIPNLSNFWIRANFKSEQFLNLSKFQIWENFNLRKFWIWANFKYEQILNLRKFQMEQNFQFWTFCKFQMWRKF
jgi:hypothetical protein